MSRPTFLSAIFLAAAACLLGAAAPAAPREYQVCRADRPPLMDADLSADLWRAAPWSGDFTGPRGASADVRTQFAMAWDERFLYVAVRCQEPKPEAIHADIAGRDPRIVNDDHVEILLAPADKPSACLQIFLNAGRGCMVERVEEGRPQAVDRALQAGLDFASRVGADEWVVEAAIPRAMVAFPLKEGASFAGDIRRVRPAGAMREMAWAPPQADRRDAAGFGLFKLSGPAPKAPPIQDGDAICLRNGDLIKGKLLSLADGKIHFSSSAFTGEVAFSAAELLRLDLAWSETDAAPARFRLNNGAEISGRIASTADEAIAVESPAIGLVSIPRALLARVSFGGFSLESHFETGVLKPWETISGECNFSNGLMDLAPAPRPAPGSPAPLAVLALPLRQDKTVTFIADFDEPARNTVIRVALFADAAHPQMQMQNGIMFLIAGPRTQFIVFKDGAPIAQPAQPQRMATGAGGVRIKVTYNPADGNAKAWLNDTLVAEMTTPDGPKEGEYALFAAARPVAVRRLAVYCGLAAPDDALPGARLGEILCDLSNGDTVRASKVQFADGNLIVTTEFGPMKVGLDRVASITFPAAAAKPPAADAAWVETGASRLALQVQEINDEFVIGRSAEFGEVKLPRRFVRSISFPAPQ